MGTGRGRKSPTKQSKKVIARATPAGWDVKWHPEAHDERRVIGDAAERVAIAHVVEKLQVDGPALRSPHQSAVMGSEGSGLRELRPRRGRSRWRPIYRRLEGSLFVILSVGPEAEIDKAGYRCAVRAARRRLRALEKAGENE